MKRKVTGASFIMALLISAAGPTLVNLATASAASAIIVAVASVGFWVYFKKNRH